MIFEVKAEQRSFIKFCVELGKTPVETKKMLEMTQSGSSVSRALVYRWHRRFTDDPVTPYRAKKWWWKTKKHHVITYVRSVQCFKRGCAPHYEGYCCAIRYRDRNST